MSRLDNTAKYFDASKQLRNTQSSKMVIFANNYYKCNSNLGKKILYSHVFEHFLIYTRCYLVNLRFLTNLYVLLIGSGQEPRW